MFMKRLTQAQPLDMLDTHVRVAATVPTVVINTGSQMGPLAHPPGPSINDGLGMS